MGFPPHPAASGSRLPLDSAFDPALALSPQAPHPACLHPSVPFLRDPSLRPSSGLALRHPTLPPCPRAPWPNPTRNPSQATSLSLPSRPAEAGFTLSPSPSLPRLLSLPLPLLHFPSSVWPFGPCVSLLSFCAPHSSPTLDSVPPFPSGPGPALYLSPCPFPATPPPAPTRLLVNHPQVSPPTLPSL